MRATLDPQETRKINIHEAYAFITIQKSSDDSFVLVDQTIEVGETYVIKEPIEPMDHSSRLKTSKDDPKKHVKANRNIDTIISQQDTNNTK